MLRLKLYRLYGVAVFDDDVVFGLYLTIFFVDRLINREELLPLEIALLLERVLLALAVLPTKISIMGNRSPAGPGPCKALMFTGIRKSASRHQGPDARPSGGPLAPVWLLLPS